MFPNGITDEHTPQHRLVPDQSRTRLLAAHRIGGAVDESQQIADVEVAECVDLVLDSHRVAQFVQDQPFQLEGEVPAVGVDVEEQGTRGEDPERGYRDCSVRPIASATGLSFPDAAVSRLPLAWCDRFWNRNKCLQFAIG